MSLFESDEALVRKYHSITIQIRKPKITTIMYLYLKLSIWAKGRAVELWGRERITDYFQKKYNITFTDGIPKRPRPFPAKHK